MLELRPTLAIGAQAVRAFALGAIAFGAIALGSMAIGCLIINRGRIRVLQIDELTVKRLKVAEKSERPET